MAFWDDIKKYAPYLLGADLATKGLGISSEKGASSDALSNYLGAHKDATEWTPEDRAAMMKAISGIYSEQSNAMKRKASTSLADRGVGGGTYGKRAEQIERQSREASARSLAGTFGPSGKPPSAQAFFKDAEAQGRNPLSETMNDALSMLGEFGVLDAMGGGKSIKSAGKGLQSLLGIGSAGGPATMSMGELAEAGGLSQAGLNTALESAAAPMANPELGAGWSPWTNVAPEAGGSSMMPGLLGAAPYMAAALAVPTLGPTIAKYGGDFFRKLLGGEAKNPGAGSYVNAYEQGLPNFKVPGLDESFTTPVSSNDPWQNINQWKDMLNTAVFGQQQNTEGDDRRRSLSLEDVQSWINKKSTLEDLRSQYK